MADKINEADGTLVIGAGVHFKGEVTVPGRATVNGKFEGELKASELVVGQSGCASGQIVVDTAEILGKVEDSLTARSKLIVRASGTVSGSITYSKIMVEEGGVLAGSLDRIVPNAAEKDVPDTNVVPMQKAD
jgi:cytoskeletal protein CcmA (bactofilin family)